MRSETCQKGILRSAEKKRWVLLNCQTCPQHMRHSGQPSSVVRLWSHACPRCIRCTRCCLPCSTCPGSTRYMNSVLPEQQSSPRHSLNSRRHWVGCSVRPHTGGNYTRPSLRTCLLDSIHTLSSHPAKTYPLGMVCRILRHHWRGYRSQIQEHKSCRRWLQQSKNDQESTARKRSHRSCP